MTCLDKTFYQKSIIGQPKETKTLVNHELSLIENEFALTTNFLNSNYVDFLLMRQLTSNHYGR